MNDFQITWTDLGREPRCKPDPRYPLGIDVDYSSGRRQTCTAQLPYPARRCGFYEIACKRCGLNVLVTTAGRIDDPRSVKLACKGN
jgi:hypothetical protein